MTDDPHTDPPTLVFAFGIDDGELADLTPERAFVLGVEFGLYYETLGKFGRWDGPVSDHNVGRFARYAKSRGGTFRCWPVRPGWYSGQATQKVEGGEPVDDEDL